MIALTTLPQPNTPNSHSPTVDSNRSSQITTVILNSCDQVILQNLWGACRWDGQTGEERSDDRWHTWPTFLRHQVNVDPNPDPNPDPRLTGVKYPLRSLTFRKSILRFAAPPLSFHDLSTSRSFMPAYFKLWFNQKSDLPFRGYYPTH